MIGALTHRAGQMNFCPAFLLQAARKRLGHKPQHDLPLPGRNVYIKIFDALVKDRKPDGFEKSPRHKARTS